MIGDNLIAIPCKVIDAFISWIGKPEANNANFDEVFVHTLLLTMVNTIDLVASKIDDAILEFIYGNNSHIYIVFLDPSHFNVF